VALLADPATFGATIADANHWTKVSRLLNTSVFYNVRNPDFGAVGDGTADDTAAINAALAAIPATGGIVYLPWGRYRVTSPLLLKNHSTTLLGAGTGQRSGATQNGVGTRIEADTGMTGDILRVQTDAATEPVYGVTLRDFTIDGKTIGSGVNGILFRCNRGLIDHVHVHKCTGNGVVLRGIASPPWDTYDTMLAHVQVGDCGGAGVLFDTDAADGHMLGCVIYNNQDSVVIKSGSEQITACHLYDATRYNVFFDGGGSRTKIEACKIEGAGQHGINIDSTNGGFSDIQVIGCGISSNGDSANNTYDNVIIQGPSGNGVGRTQIVGNAIGVKSGVTNEARYGVNLASTAAQNTQVLGNVFTAAASFGTAAANDAGSTSLPPIIRHNINWVTEASGIDSVASGQTSKAVTHGLSLTPALKDIVITLTNNPTVNVRHWVSAVGATTFTVTTSADPGASGLAFAWQAQVL